ncbi:epidermal retinol dehydrogenase 2 isoform X2 [Cherax quadricarinatus]|uniref:epidermal retinol dehydrogenase 2 isoform X2 n=1 Tax=Cherax quadricarinatus TaxID=27406 RepID=UPI00237904D5|nr:epidermal retinol dehydrogenase 2-like isoform X1 [Cherax quadricarinatus]
MLATMSNDPVVEKLSMVLQGLLILTAALLVSTRPAARLFKIDITFWKRNQYAKIKTWEVMVELMGFIILNLKAIFLLFLDVYYLIIPPEERSLQGQLVLVTGAGQNLGRELSLQLARLGAKMILLDVNEEQNKITADMIRDAGGEAYSFTCDVSDQKSVAAIGTKVRKEIGHPGYVFNNAGVYKYKPFLSHTPEEIQMIVNVNLLGNLWISREFLGHMIQHNRGHIICISSVLGFIGRNNVVPYCSSKFGVKGMTEALAEEMRMERRSGVKITAVHPFLISNIEDVTPNLKYPWLFEILEPSDAASRIIRGVRRGQEEIFLPEKLKPLMVFSKVLPRKLRRLFGDYVEK